MTILRAATCSMDELRSLRLALDVELKSLNWEAALVIHLQEVVWELIINVEHAQLPKHEEVVVQVRVQPPSIIVSVPGNYFDSVAAGRKSTTRGLWRSYERLRLCSWDWIHSYDNGINKIQIGSKPMVDRTARVQVNSGNEVEVRRLLGEWDRAQDLLGRRQVTEELQADLSRPVILDLTDILHIDSWGETAVCNALQILNDQSEAIWVSDSSRLAVFEGLRLALKQWKLLTKEFSSVDEARKYLLK